MSKYQYPRINDENIFENFIRDLFNKIYQNPDFQLFGKKGQNQKGIDVISIKNKIAIQCKCKKDVSKSNYKNIRKQLIKDINSDIEKTKAIKLNIEKLIFVSTFIDDVELQEYTSKLKNENFIIEYWGWETLISYLEKFNDLINEYFPQFYIDCSDEVLIRNDYYNIILELIELERISIDYYLENKYKKYIKSNPHFIQILYKDINFVLKGIYDNNDLDLIIENGDFETEYGDLKLSGQPNNLIYAQIFLFQKLTSNFIEKGKFSINLLKELEHFEKDFLNNDYNTLEYSKKLQKLRDNLIADKQSENRQENIEFVSVDIDSQNCSWIKDDKYDTVFWDTKSTKSPFPIFDFCILNNTKSTIVLKSIKCKWQHLYSGLQGLPFPTVIKSITRYDLFIDTSKEINKVDLFDPIQVPSEQSVRFQVQTLLGTRKNKEFEQFQGRNTLKFVFEFNNNITLNLPEILLNTINNKDGIELHILT